MIKHVTKEYKYMNVDMAKYLIITIRLLSEFDHVIVQHIARIKNEKVNALAQIITRHKVNKSKSTEMIIIKNIYIQSN